MIDPDTGPVIIFDPESLIIQGGARKPVIYDPAEQARTIDEIFEELRKGVEKRSSPSEPDRHWIWLFPYLPRRFDKKSFQTVGEPSPTDIRVS